MIKMAFYIMVLAKKLLKLKIIKQTLKYNSIKKDDEFFYAYDKNNEKIGKVRFIK